MDESSPSPAAGESDSPQSGIALWLAILASGLLVGGLSVAFHAGLDFALRQREQLTFWAKPLGAAGALLLVAVCAIAVGLAVWMTGRFAPLAAGSGIQHVEGVERGVVKLWPLSVVWVKFVGGILGIGGGLVLGREGPTVQMGASLAEHLGARFGLSSAARRNLLVVGAGAGLAGAFNAPLAGTLFVVEELKCPLHPAIYLGTLLASVVTDLCCRFWLGQAPELALPRELPPPLLMLAPVVLVGALGGVIGVIFNAVLMRALVLMDRCKQRVPAWMLGVAMGVVLGGVAWFVPALPGGGVVFAARVLDGGISTAAALWLLPLSFVLTIGSYAIGAPGGIFAPLLVLGALLGLLFHGAWLAVLPAPTAAMPVLAAAAMAALFAGVVRAPLTGAVLLVEMTGSYAIVLPLILASLAAYAVAEALGNPPIYESLLQRELRRLQAST
ncbi:MAG: chloride channel protein [Deltaproteobacteria bacterium]|nr:chloride channel protein [Deltaproteobacteria bacterium]MBI3390168.1 chloride channel protein [Deltaproteobacteria bacterium]